MANCRAVIPGARWWRLDRACTLAAWAVCAVAFALLAWRAALPNNQHRDTDQVGPALPGEMWGQNADGYDDVVTVVTARNFARDGFLRTHFLPNRKFAPLASFLDFGHNQCLALEPLEKPAMQYRSVFGEWQRMTSLTGDCIYTHYPPLADWVFGAMATAGLESILAYRLLAIAMSCLTLGLFFLWLRREVHPAAALAATVLVAVSPAFFQWAAALFHVGFQYLFLIAGLLSWSTFLERRRRRWFALTWLLFFLQALTSYELVAFFAIVVAGLAALDGKGASFGRRAGWVLALGAATVAAVALHLALRVSLFGFEATWQNLSATASARAGAGWGEWRQRLLLNRLQLRLLRPELAAVGIALVLAVRSVVGARPWRAAALLGIMIAGGASFFALFPGTTWLHGWMMYRHLLPATALLLALLVDAAMLALSFRPARPPATAPPARRLLTASVAVGAALLSLVPCAWFLRQSLAALRREIAWTRAANQHRDPANHAVRYLESFHWLETGTPYYTPQTLLTVDGRRVDDSPDPDTRFALVPNEVQHYELWWLDEVSLRSVRFLSEEPSAAWLAQRCRVSLFDGEGFHRIDAGQAFFHRFEPDDGEPRAPDYVWWVVPVQGRPTRGLRLTCAELPGPVALYEVEAY